MTSFASLSSLIRAFFALWALLLCLTDIVGAVLTLVKKRYVFALTSGLLFVPVYFLWQVVFDLSLSERSGLISSVSKAIVSIPWAAWLSAFLLLTIGSTVLLILYFRYQKTSITSGAIKSYLDEIPCGVCCWQENGRVLFSNICMNELCLALTDSPLLNGNQFYEAVADEIKAVDGKKWRFTCRELNYGGEPLKEMIASDVTTEYAKTQALEKDKAELSRLNRELKEYTLSIDDTVRRQEILQAKVNIHDEMNKLMLSTVAAESEDFNTLDRIFSLWDKNALLLCMDADKKTTGLEELAKALKIRLIINGDVPGSLSEKQRGLLYSAANEAMINATKHALATRVTISFVETEGIVICAFSNDGVILAEKVDFTGGLANLKRLADMQGAKVSVEVGDVFTLYLTFPIGNKPNG